MAQSKKHLRSDRKNTSESRKKDDITHKPISERTFRIAIAVAWLFSGISYGKM